MKSIEVKAKTIDEAIEDACSQLGVSQTDVDIEILSQGGMFGKARVICTIKDDYKPAKPEPQKTETPATTSALDALEEVMPESRTVRAEELETKDKPGRVPQTPITSEKASGVEIASQVTPIKKGDKFKTTTEFVTKLLELLENDSTVTTEETEAAFNINVVGENIGRLIGKSGLVLNAIQTVVTSIAISNSNGENKRVLVNVGDYREKRGDTLNSIAMKKVEYVKRTGRFVKLDPMNARERAIIHTALQNIEGIKTYSTGKDPFRCLCIAPADKQDS